MKQLTRTARLRRGLLVLTLLAALLLGACEERVPSQSSLPAAQAEGVDGEEPGLEIPDIPSTQPEPGEEEPEGIDDPEQVEQARQIVLEAMERAEVCDTIFQAKLKYDRYTDPLTMPDTTGTYAPVVDDRFATMDDVQDYWRGTFDMNGETAALRYQDMQNMRLYMHINGELCEDIDAQMPRLTMGEWDVSTLSLLEMGGNTLVARMDTRLAGRDNGRQNLELTYDGSHWLLEESYFLD